MALAAIGARSHTTVITSHSALVMRMDPFIGIVTSVAITICDTCHTCQLIFFRVALPEPYSRYRARATSISASRLWGASNDAGPRNSRQPNRKLYAAPY